MSDAAFWAKVSKGPHPKGCWLFRGIADNYGSYCGQPAHRFSYTDKKGPIPEGLIIRHRCDVPGCVRPGHLEVGTPMDNHRDMDKRGRRVKAYTYVAQPGKRDPLETALSWCAGGDDLGGFSPRRRCHRWLWVGNKGVCRDCGTKVRRLMARQEILIDAEWVSGVWPICPAWNSPEDVARAIKWGLDRAKHHDDVMLGDAAGAP